MSPIPHLDVDLDDVAARGAPLASLAQLVDELGFPGAARRVRRVVDGLTSGPDRDTAQVPTRAPGTAAASMPPMPPPPDDRDAPPA
jgi:hypothetical protein